MYVIRVVDVPGRVGYNPLRLEEIGQFFRTLDVDAYDGRGWATFTKDVQYAAKFPTPIGAWKFWGQQSTVKPLRADGRPNRPGTAFTVEIVQEADLES
jgi:hypothetical protein